jgi:RNA polymerase sigma-70 factor (ECF subfamily)
MVAIAYSYLADRDLAQDAVQEAFTEALSSIAKLKRPERFARWLATVCRNTAIDMAKARARQKCISLEDCSSISDDKDKEDKHIETVRDVISRLPERMREVIFLRYYNRMSYQEISNVVGISQQAVHGRLRRAKKTIAKKLLQQGSVEVKL